MISAPSVEQESDKMGRNCRQWSKLGVARYTKILLSVTNNTSPTALSRLSRTTQQHLLYYALDVNGDSRFTTPAEPNLFSELVTYSRAQSHRLGHRLDKLPAMLTDQVTDSDIDWTSKIGHFHLLPGSEAQFSTPVLKVATTQAFYQAPSWVTADNLRSCSISDNWSRAKATLNDGVREMNIAEYVAHQRPLPSPRDCLHTPERALPRPSPKSGNKSKARTKTKAVSTASSSRRKPSESH